MQLKSKKEKSYLYLCNLHHKNYLTLNSNNNIVLYFSLHFITFIVKHQ